MNIAEEIIDWLYKDQLQIDEQWSHLLPTGFTWWADQYAQTVEFVREEKAPTARPGTSSAFGLSCCATWI